MQNRIEILFRTQNDANESVRSCLEILFGTREGEQALDRSFGISWDFLDNPTPVARAMLAQDIIAKAAKYEPRAKIISVDYKYGATEGIMIPRVSVEVVED